MKTLTDAQTDLYTSAVGMVVPEAVLVGTACALFVLAVAVPRRTLALPVALIGLALAAIAALKFGPWELATFAAHATAATAAPIDPTGIAGFVRWLSLGSAGLYLLVSYAEVRDDNACEYAACLLVMTAGTSLVGRANDLISLFLALEMVSIPTYVLLYLPTRSRAGQESAAKYFLLSILSSGVLLFGFSYLYGAAGTTNLGAAVAVLTEAHADWAAPLAAVGAVMVLAGLAFRVAAVPFHFYAPDVYEGGPTGVVAQLAVVPKVAGFVALARVLGLADPAGGRVPFPADATLIPLTLWVIAAVTMTFGNVLGLLQNNLKRLFAYSGIANSGYLLIGLLAAAAVPGRAGLDAVLVYLVAYTLMTVGAFAVLMYLNSGETPVETVDDLAGLGQANPFAAGLMTVFLFSLIGLPLTAGFVGKLLLFLSAFEVPVDGPLQTMPRVLVVIAAVNAAVAAVYYLRAVGAMYLRTPLAPAAGRGPLPLAAAAVCAAATVVIGVYPNPLASTARDAAGVTPAPVTNAVAAGPAAR